MASNLALELPFPLEAPSPKWHQLQLLNRISQAYKLELRRLSTRPPDDPPSSDKADASKDGHIRRREQVRRAQKKHRERKEIYIKSLEQQILQLLNQQSTSAEEKRAIREENAMLKGLLLQHGISIPNHSAGFGPAATVSMLDAPDGHQRLAVTMPKMPPDVFAEFDMLASTPRDTTSPESPDINVSGHFSSDHSTIQGGVPSAPLAGFQTRLPSKRDESLPATRPKRNLTEKGLPPLPNHTPLPTAAHPSGLDLAQVGIDFVLALENPCLSHTRKDLESQESYGHILTFQAPLLTHGPRPLEPASSWKVPAIEIERLLNLSAQLNLDGELTPVQAWSRVRSCPGFQKLNVDQLERLKGELLKEVHCYGFGAVMDETAFENVLRQCIYGQ